MRYHLNPTTGNPNICRAALGKCPFGAEAPHYGSKEEARRGYETLQTSNSQKKLSKKAQSNVDPKHGFLRRELAEKLTIHDINCSKCGEPVNPRGAQAMISDNLADCPCGAELDFDIEIKLTEGNPSYRFLDKEEVRKATWFHSTNKEDWLEELEDYGTIHDEETSVDYFQAHVGTEAAAFDRAITNYAPHSNWGSDFYIYEVALDEQVTIADEIPQDENNDRALALGSDVTRYINRWEDMASISLAVRSDKLKVVNKRLVTKEEAHEQLTPYNLPSPEEVDDYWEGDSK